jgi:hypothetical protein
MGNAATSAGAAGPFTGLQVGVTAACIHSKGFKHLGQHIQVKDTLTQLVLGMKAEMGSMRKAMIRSGISFDRSPNEQKPRESSANGKQKNNFTGMVKKKN